LCFQFYEADEQFRRQEAQLRSRLDQLEKESEQHQAVVDALTSKYTDTIEKLQSDKARLEVREAFEDSLVCLLGMGMSARGHDSTVLH